MIIVKTLQSTLVNKEKEIWICGGVMLKQQSTKKKCSIVFNMKNDVIMKNHWRGYGVLSDNVWVINALPPLRHPLPHHLPAICFLTQLHLSLFIYFFFGCTHGTQKFLGQALNLSCSCSLCHSCSHARLLHPQHHSGTPLSPFLISQLP